MACIWMDGFEIGEATDTAGLWSSIVSSSGNGSIEYDATNPRSFTGSLKVTNTDAGDYRYISKVLPSANAQLYGSFGLYINSSQALVDKYANVIPFFAVRASNGIAHLHMGFDIATMQLVVYKGDVAFGGVKVGTGINALQLDTWNHIQWRYIINNASGLVQVRLNGQFEINESPIDTKTSGLASIASVQIGLMGGTAIINIDDFVINDTSGSVSNEWPGNASVQLINPAGNGTYSDWTSTGATMWQEVDDLTTHGVGDGDATAISGLLSGDRASATLESITANGPINAVMLISQAKNADVGDDYMAQFVRLSATDYDSDVFIPSFGNYAWRTDILNLNPDTNAQWLEAEINAIELGWVIV